MTPGLTCAACHGPLYPRLAKRSETGWVCSDRRACERTRRHAERYEDVDWLASTGESLTGAAARIGLHPEVLARWCRRHAPEQLASLMRHEPRAVPGRVA